MADPSKSPPPPPPPVPSSPSGALDSPAGTAALMPAGAGERVSFRISNWAVARYTLISASVLIGLYLLWRIQEVLLLLLLAILFATAIEPLVDRLRRGPFSRGQGVLIVYSAIFAIVAGVGFLFVPGLVDQASRFVDTLPNQIAALRPRIEQLGGPHLLRDVLLRLVGEAQPVVERTLQEPGPSAASEQIVQAGGAFARTLLGLVTVFLLAYYWLTERPIIKRGVLRLAPASKVRQVNDTWLLVEARLGGWVRGQIVIMAAIAVMAGLAFVLLGLPNPLFLAVLAGLCEIIPMVGPFLAFVPAVLVALTIDPSKALLLVPIAIAIQQIEGNVLIPRVMSQSVGISPLTVILGILIGEILYGAAGAFLAVPVAAAIQEILNATLRPSLEEDGNKVPVPEPELEDEPPGVEASRPGPASASPAF